MILGKRADELMSKRRIDNRCCLDARWDRKAFGFNAQMDFQQGMIETVEG